MKQLKMTALALAVCIGTAANADPQAGAPAPVADPDVFAVVNGTVISVRDYEAAFSAGARQKFYHGRAAENQLVQFRREIGEELINRELLLAEAHKRGLQAEAAKVDELIAGYEARYQESPQWKHNRERVLPDLRRHLEQRNVLEQMEQSARNVADPTERQLADYYAAHPDLFTEPERVRLSVILLKVDPSSPQATWQEALEKAAGIHKQLEAGASFEELARAHSKDRTADGGGDMGYLHRGMLSEGVHEAVDKLQPGMTSEPVRILEGIAILRLLDRKISRLASFEQVRPRAAELWKREQSDFAWKKFVAGLRQAAIITLNEKRFPEFAAASQSRNEKGGPPR